MVDIKHKRQINDGFNWKCGEVCLEMVFDFFEVQYDSDYIWESIKEPRHTGSGQMYALTHKLAATSIAYGLPATIYKGKSIEVLKKIDKLCTPAILSVTQEKSRQSHFIVFKGIKNSLFYYCDPDVERNFSYANEPKMDEAWKTNLSANVTGYIFVVLDKTIDVMTKCPYCHNDVPVVHSSLTSQTVGLCCPYCDTIFPYKTDTHTEKK